MADHQRPEAVIKVYPKDFFDANPLKILAQLKKTNAMILKLQENISGNVFNQPFPYMTFRRITSSEKLPKNLKMDGDPLSDYFNTLKAIKGNEKASENVISAFIILAFKVIDDDRTCYYDQTWQDWSGAQSLSAKLAQVYDIRKIVCFKGVNVVPDVFKYIVMIEFLIDEESGQCDNYARDCMQRFRISRMSGYAALYTDCRSRDIEKSIEEVSNMDILEME